MKLLADCSPRALAALTLLGACVAGSIFLVVLPLRSHLLLDLTCLIILLGGGMTLSFKSQAELQNGVQNDRWPLQQIEPLRAIVDSPFFTFGMFVLFGAYVTVFIVHRHSRWHDIAWVAFLLMQSCSQLQRALRPPTPPKALQMKLRDFAPLQSNHWGQR